MLMEARNLHKSNLKTIEEKVKTILDELKHCNDLYVRRFRTISGQNGALLFIQGITDEKEINENIFPQILRIGKEEKVTEAFLLETFPYCQLKTSSTKNEIIDGILTGNIVIVFDKLDTFCLLNAEKKPERSPESPIIETTIKGTKEGFADSSSVNVSIIRKYLKSPKLQIQDMKIGSLSQTKVTVLFIDGIVNQDVLEEVRQRLSSIETEKMISASELEQWTEDNMWSIFPLVRLSDRPDVAVESLNSGKVILFVDNSPLALLVPFTFFESLQNMDDYYEKWYVGSMVRIVRLIAMLISVFLPSLYVALIHFNPELIPSDLLMAIAHTRVKVPFPAIWELLLMELMIEIFREAGARLPKPLGQTVGIVGGIVIGEAAVQANIVGPITLIVVGITAMASFSTPHYSMAFSFRLLRLLLIIGAGFFGLFGLILGFSFILLHLSSLKSFGVPYLVPFAPTKFRNWVDLFILFPIRYRTMRPTYLADQKKQRKWKPLKRG